MSNTYWGKTGTHQEAYDQLFATLVPGDGKSDTVAGELLRAITRVYYDGYNNGFHNNTSGPVKFLMQHLPADNPVTTQLNSVYYACNTFTNHSGLQRIYDYLELIVDYVVEYVPTVVNEINKIDMWDLSDPDCEDDFEEEEDFEEYDDL